MNRDDVEPAGATGEVMPGDVVERELGQPATFARRNRFGGISEGPAVARLDLYEHNRAPFAADDVNFATAPPVAPGDNRVPAAFELGTRQIFTSFPQNHTGS